MWAKINILIMVICYGLAFLVRVLPRNEKEGENAFKIISSVFLIGVAMLGFVFLVSY
jgi:hypothetical protein